MKNLLNLSFKFQIRKKTTILNIILIVIAFLIVLGINMYSDSATNYMENDVYNSVYFKSLGVSINENENRDEARKTIEKLENVSLVSNFYSYSDILTSKELSNKKLPGEIQLYVANNKTLPQIVKGINFPDDEGNYLICPTTLYSTSNYELMKNISSHDAIDTKKLLNKKFDFSYKSHFEKYNYNTSFKLIGLYESGIFLDSNICFTQEHSLEEILQNKFADDIDKENNIPNIEYQTSLFVQVDNFDNLEKVQNQLSNLGYRSEPNAMIIPSYFENVKKVSKKISFIVLILTFLLILIVSLKQYNEDLKSYKLLKYLGYKKSMINIISIASNLLQLLISLISALLIFLILYMIFKIYLIYYPYVLNNWKVIINLKSITSVVIVILLSTIFSIFINILRLNRK